MKFKRKKPVYKPKPINNKEMDRGIEELFAKQKRERESPQQQVQPQQQNPQQQAPPQQQNPQQRMNIPNPLGGGNKAFNPPNPLGAESTHLKGDMDVINQQPAPMKFNAPNEWGVKPLNIPQNPSPFRQIQQQQQPRPTQQTKLEDFGMRMQQPQPQQQPQQQLQQQQQETEEEPYWSAEEWEAWAYQTAVNYPDVQQFLPEWFMQALQEEE